MPDQPLQGEGIETEYIEAWRLADPEWEDTPEKMLSGDGAEQYGGRWNSRGTPVVYLGESRALVCMEMLAHAQDSNLLDQYVLMAVSIPVDSILQLDSTTLPEMCLS